MRFTLITAFRARNNTTGSISKQTKLGRESRLATVDDLKTLPSTGSENPGMLLILTDSVDIARARYRTGSSKSRNLFIRRLALCLVSIILLICKTVDIRQDINVIKDIQNQIFKKFMSSFEDNSTISSDEFYEFANNASMWNQWGDPKFVFVSYFNSKISSVLELRALRLNSFVNYLQFEIYGKNSGRLMEDNPRYPTFSERLIHNIRHYPSISYIFLSSDAMEEATNDDIIVNFLVTRSTLSTNIRNDLFKILTEFDGIKDYIVNLDLSPMEAYTLALEAESHLSVTSETSSKLLIKVTKDLIKQSMNNS